MTGGWLSGFNTGKGQRLYSLVVALGDLFRQVGLSRKTC